MKKSFVTMLSFISLISIGVLSIYAVYDVSSAQGFGYFFFLKTGLFSRSVFDVFSVIALSVLFGLAVYVPLCALKLLSLKNFNRLTVLYVALMPSVTPADFLSLFSEPSVYKFGEDLTAFAVIFIDFFRILVPLYILLAGILIVIKNQKPEKGTYTAVLIALLVLVVSIPFPGLYIHASWIAAYILVILIFKAMDRLEKNMSFMYILLWFTALYRIINVCESFNL